jgi:hypothetical protein
MMSSCGTFKGRLGLMLVVLAVAGVGLVAMAREPGSKAPPARGEPSSVEGAMKTMGRSLKALRGIVGDASKKEEALRLVSEMQRACLWAKSAPVPGDVLDRAKDDAERSAIKVANRVYLIAVLQRLLVCEQNIIEGNVEAASADIKAVAELRDKGHRAIGIKDD